jgi:hypothetical protein
MAAFVAAKTQSDSRGQTLEIARNIIFSNEQSYNEILSMVPSEFGV